MPNRDSQQIEQQTNGCHTSNLRQCEASLSVPPFEDRPPRLDRVGPYDEKHLTSYLRLLDAEAEGADWKEAVAIIFGLDAEKEPERAKLVYDSHLARAHWMTAKGYRHLLEPPMQ